MTITAIKDDVDLFKQANNVIFNLHSVYMRTEDAQLKDLLDDALQILSECVYYLKPTQVTPENQTLDIICRKKCRYRKHGKCDLHNLYIVDGDCKDFVEYPGNDRSYQEEYWIARCPNKDGVITREKRKGKKITALGRTFFTEDDIRYEKYKATYTDAETGYEVPGILFDREDLQAKYFEKIKTIPSVMTYPVYEEPVEEEDESDIE